MTESQDELLTSRHRRPGKTGLYDPALEHDACGVGFVAHIKGKRSHQILVDANDGVLRRIDARGVGVYRSFGGYPCVVAAVQIANIGVTVVPK